MGLLASFLFMALFIVLIGLTEYLLLDILKKSYFKYSIVYKYVLKRIYKFED